MIMTNSRQKLMIGLVALAAGVFSAHGVPARPAPFTFTQPDGTQITVQLRGYEHAHCYVSEDGYMLVNDNETLYYATLSEAGKVQASKFVAKPLASRTLEEKSFLSTIDREAVFAAKAKAVASRPKRTPGVGLFPDKRFPAQGEKKALVILVEFKDRKFVMSDPHDYFSRMLNEEDFSDYNGTGSARDYFIDQSEGKFSPQFDVYGPVAVSQKMSYYGNNDVSGVDMNPHKMVLEACELIDDVVDFKDYDTNNDGDIDNVFVFYAGLGEASGGPSYTIWPHSSEMSAWGSTEYKFDGVRLEHYACGNEWFGDAYTGKPDGIGCFVHEFGHVIGLPDLYDTLSSTSSVQVFTPGNWDTQDQGNYNNNSRTPPFYSAFERNALNWLKSTRIDRPMSCVLPSLGNNVAFVIETNDPNEFFLLENRQQVGWDTYVPHHGMLVWHVQYDEYVWTDNEVNHNPNHQFVDIEEADYITNKATINGDPFPGAYNITEFTDNTRPSMRTWSGKALNLPITNIKEEDGVITFDVCGGGEKVIAGETGGVNDVKESLKVAVNGRTIVADNAQVFGIEGKCFGNAPVAVETGLYIVKSGTQSAKIFVK